MAFGEAFEACCWDQVAEGIEELQLDYNQERLPFLRQVAFEEAFEEASEVASEEASEEASVEPSVEPCLGPCRDVASLVEHRLPWAYHRQGYIRALVHRVEGVDLLLRNRLGQAVGHTEELDHRDRQHLREEGYLYGRNRRACL